MISVDEIYTHNQLRQIKTRWNSLLTQCRCCVPYLSFQWYLSALETMDKDKEPLLIFFKSSNKDIGFAPLVRKRMKLLGFTLDVISFVHNPYTPWQAFVYLDKFENVLTGLIKYLRNRFGGLFSLNLNEVRLTESEETAIDNLAGRGLILFRCEEKSGSRYLILGESFDQTLKNLKKKTQKEFKRKLRRISEIGKLDLIRIQGKNQLEQHLDYFFRLYARTWKGKEPRPEFYYHLCTRFENLGALFFYALTLNDKPIAYLICLQGGDTMYAIKTTYDPSYYDFSPGIVLFYKCIEDMFNIPQIREFDIGRGNEQFKREWTSLSHQHTKLLIYPNTVFRQFANRLRYNVLPHLRRYDTFEKVYSTVRSLLLQTDDEGQDRSLKPKNQDHLLVDVPSHVSKMVKQSDEPLVIPQEEAETFYEIDPEKIEKIVQERNEARRAKKWAKADAIREELSKKGIILEDGQEGPSWRFRFDQDK